MVVEVHSVGEMISVFENELEKNFSILTGFEKSIDISKFEEWRNSKEGEKHLDRLENQSSVVLSNYLIILEVLMHNGIQHIAADAKMIAETAPNILSLYTLINRMKSDDNKPQLLFGSEIVDFNKCVVLLKSRDISIPEFHPFLQQNIEYLPQSIEKEDDESFTMRFCADLHHKAIMRELGNLKKLTEVH